jgi:hypothetical protein
MEKKIIYFVECRLYSDGKTVSAYFEKQEDAQDSLLAFRRKHGYDSIVSIKEIALTTKFVDFSEML